MAAKRIQLVVGEEFLADIDKAAAKFQLSRSAFMNMCCAYTMLSPTGIVKLRDKKELLAHFKKYAEDSLKAEGNGETFDDEETTE